MEYFTRSSPVLDVRGIHLDLKGHQPTEKRLLELPDILAAMKINTILIEWEDTFCWKEPEMRSPTAYSRKEILKFLDALRTHGIAPIPLVQTFGHLETLLQIDKHKDLREIKTDNRDLCPSNPKSRQVIARLIDEIWEVHRDYSHYLHMGGDEVGRLGTCKACSNQVKKTSKVELYLSHMEGLFDYMNSKGCRSIIWHDMLRFANEAVLKRLATKTDLMVWTYEPNIFDSVLVSQEMIKRFQAAGLNLWGASAFKGADGIERISPNLNNRMANTLAWTRTATKYHFVGMIATGWSRYGTSFVPCETLESCLDSLFLAAAAMWDGKVPSGYEKTILDVFKDDKFIDVLGERAIASVLAGRKLEQLKQNCLNEITNNLARVDPTVSDVPTRINPEIVTEHLRWFKKFTGKIWPASVKEFRQTHQGKLIDNQLDGYLQSQTAMLEKRMRLLIKK
jgi:hypothetical protein